MPRIARLGARQLAGKVIDSHAHIGVSVLGYLSGSYPYCHSVDALLCQMDAHGVDCTVVTPFGESAYFDTHALVAKRHFVPARPAISPAPYVRENRLLCEEVYELVPRAQGRILPFPIVDPARCIGTQLRELERLAGEYPIYGVKVCGVILGSSHRHLRGKAEGFVRFAEERNLPMLLHTTAYARDPNCNNAINLAVVRANPRVRFSLAHCMGFDKVCLDEVDAMPHAWVDSAALKIQVEPEEILAPKERRFPSDYANLRTVFRDLVRAYPATMLWGTDSPAYTYVTKRQYADGHAVYFALHGTYSLEREALDALTPARRRRVANRNTLQYLFG